MSLDEIASTLTLPKSTVHRLLETLKSSGFVAAASQFGSYRLGVEAAIVGSRAIQAQRPRAEVREIIARSAAQIGETIGLGVLDGRRVLVIEKGVPPRPFTWHLPVGSTMPAHATAAGKVLLSGLTDREVERRLGGDDSLPPSGPNAVRSLAELREQIGLVRLRGYAIDDEEFEEGLRCVAVPVRALDGGISHSLGITAPVSRISHAQLRSHAEILGGLADDIGRYLAMEEVAAAL